MTAPFSMPKFYFGAAWDLDANQVLLSWILLRVGLIFFFFFYLLIEFELVLSMGRLTTMLFFFQR